MERTIKLGLTITLALTCILSCISGNSQEKENEGNSNFSTRAIPTSKEAVLTKLEEDKITYYGEWDAGEDLPLRYMMQSVDDKNVFTIGDDSGKILYMKKEVEFQRAYQIWALRTANSQLVLQYSMGGNDSFIQLLDYEDGKIREIVDSTGNENSFGAGAQIRPNFRSGLNPGKEPFEIVLTDGGLAGPTEKTTKVFRYKNGKYRYYGKYPQQDVDSYTESLISR